MRVPVFSILLIASGIFTVARAQTDANNNERNHYTYKRESATKHLDAYSSCAVLTSDINSVRTLRGDILHSGKDTVINFRVNPTGINLGVIGRNKKGAGDLSFYSAQESEKKLNQFNTKLYGIPTAMTYTPDARVILVAAGDAIYFIEPKKYQVFDKMTGVPSGVTRMSVSPNGYYLAVTDKHGVTVYNLEEKKKRHEMQFDEKVTQILFSPDNNDFAVLTDDGLLTIYNTRNFEMRKIIDNLGDAVACTYNFDGKYMAVVTADDTVTLVNLMRDKDRELFASETGGITDVSFISDSNDNTLLIYPTSFSIEAYRLPDLKPFYNRLIADEVERRMDEWLKMMPGETMEEYRLRVTDESRAKQRRLFEDEISTNLAGNLLEGATMTLGTYDRSNEVLALNFNDMPTIYLPIPEAEVTAIRNADDLKLSDVVYGILPDDTFEIVYATVTNKTTGRSYVYDNLNRARIEFIPSEDSMISLEVLQQQQMEELKLQELREKVLKEAKKMNVITDNTNITVDSKVIPGYDADGKKILNYQIGVTYTVDPEFSAKEDFGPGKYHVKESGAASSMLKIVKEAFEGEFKQYMENGKRVKVRILGTADATPIIRPIAYDGSYGEYTDEPVYVDGRLQALTVTSDKGLTRNDQLAFLRALGVKDFLEKNIKGYGNLHPDYRYEVAVSKDKGSEYRRITLEFTFIDAY